MNVPWLTPSYTAFGAEPLSSVNSQTPGSNTQHLLELFALACSGATPCPPEVTQQWESDLAEARRIEDSPAPEAAGTEKLLAFAEARDPAAPPEVIAALRQKLDLARIREQGVQLSSREIFRAFQMATDQATADNLMKQYAVALDRELTGERALRVDDVFRFLRWQQAILRGESPQYLDAVKQLFLEQHPARLDSTFLNQAFANARAKGLPDPLLQRLKTMQRPLLQAEIDRARAAGATASAVQAKKVLEAAIAAGSAPLLVDELRRIADQASARETKAAADAASSNAKASDATEKPVSPKREPSKLRQLGAILLVLSPALIPLVVLNLPGKK